MRVALVHRKAGAGHMNTNHAKKCWYVAATSDEVTESPVGRRVLGQNVVLWLGTSGRASAFEPLCTPCFSAVAWRRRW
ncbi:MAG: hypothetical protein QOC85_3993 [Streptomyces sp.]|nr:hypothetical protein [Streptomyces sp.]